MNAATLLVGAIGMTGDRSRPTQAVRLTWFLLLFFTPMSAIAYVSTYGLKDGSRDAFIHVLLILGVSLVVSLLCAIAQPIQVVDETSLTYVGRLNLVLA